MQNFDDLINTIYPGLETQANEQKLNWHSCGYYADIYMNTYVYMSEFIYIICGCIVTCKCTYFPSNIKCFQVFVTVTCHSLNHK